MGLWVRDGGQWKEVSALSVRDGESWKSVTALSVRDGGAWKTVSLGAGAGNLTPPIIQSLSPTHEKVTVTWSDESTAEDEFDVGGCSGGGCDPTTSVIHTEPSTTEASTGTLYNHDDTGLAEDTTRRYAVRAVDTAGPTNGNWSAVAETTTRLNPPTGASASSASPTSVLVEWTDNSAAATDHRVRYREDGTTDPWTEETTGSGDSTSHTVGGLTAGTTYEFEVRAEKTGNDSVWVAAGTATPSDAPVLDSVVWDGGDGSPGSCGFQVDWTDNSPDETGFEIYRCAGSSCNPFAGTLVDSVGAGVTSYLDSSVTENSGDYTYGIRKKGGAQGDQDSNTVSATSFACVS